MLFENSTECKLCSTVFSNESNVVLKKVGKDGKKKKKQHETQQVGQMIFLSSHEGPWEKL